MKVIQLLIALCLVGCLSPSYTHNAAPKSASIYVPVYITDAYPDVRRELIGAVSEWNNALNSHIVLVVSPDDIVDFRRAQEENAIVIKMVSVGEPMLANAHLSGAMGLTDIWGTKIPAAVIYIVNTLSPKTARHILLHELGHTMGADDKDYSLMQLHYSVEYCCIDKDTMMQVANANGWDIRSLNWCY